MWFAGNYYQSHVPIDCLWLNRSAGDGGNLFQTSFENFYRAVSQGNGENGLFPSLS